MVVNESEYYSDSLRWAGVPAGSAGFKNDWLSADEKCNNSPFKTRIQCSNHKCIHIMKQRSFILEPLTINTSQVHRSVHAPAPFPPVTLTSNGDHDRIHGRANKPYHICDSHKREHKRHIRAGLRARRRIPKCIFSLDTTEDKNNKQTIAQRPCKQQLYRKGNVSSPLQFARE